MALVKFQLHHKYKDGSYQIRISYRCEDGRYYKEAMKERAKETQWKSTSGRLIPSAKDSGKINAYLDEQQTRLESATREMRLSGQRITPEAIKAKLSGSVEGFWGFFDEFILYPPPAIGKKRLQHYKGLYLILKRFEKRHRKIEFNSFDQGFADLFTRFMRDVPYKENAAGGQSFYNDNTIRWTFKRIKALLNYARKSGTIKTLPEFSTSAKGIDAGAIYLTEDEILLFYKAACEFAQPLNKSGKFFVLGTQIGSRVGYLDIDPTNKLEVSNKNKKNLYLNLSTNKVPVPVIIPLSKIAVKILDEFEWIVKIKDHKRFNEHIKIIAEKAGLNSTVIDRAIESGKLIERTYKKWELVSSHTMRRSYATNLIKAGANPIDVMKAGGWKSWSSFQKYLLMSSMDSAEALGKLIK